MMKWLLKLEVRLTSSFVLTDSDVKCQAYSLKYMQQKYEYCITIQNTITMFKQVHVRTSWKKLLTAGV